MKRLLLLLFLPVLCAAQDGQPLLSRDEALRIGRSGNISLQGAAQQREAALASRSAATGSLLPALALASTLARTGPNLAGDPRNAGAVSFQPDLQWTGSLQFTWSLFNPGSWGTWKSSVASAEAADDHLRGQLVQVSAAIDLAYFDVVRQQRLLDAAQEELGLSRTRRDIAVSHRAIGVVSALEPLQAQLSMDGDSASLLSQLSSLDLSRRTLNWMLGRDPRTGFRVEDSIPLPDPGTFDQILSDARSGSAGLAEADAKSRAARASSDAAALSAVAPTLSAFATYGLLGRWHDRNPPADLTAQGFAYGLQASWNLFSGGSQAAQSALARAQARSAELARADTALQLERGVLQAWDAWTRARSAVDLGDRGQRLADSVLVLAAAQFRAGAISGVDLRTAQENAQQARARAVQARWSARAAGVQLLVLSGREIR